MKKLTLFVLAAVICLTFAACDGNRTYTGSEEELIAMLPEGYPYEKLPLTGPVELISAKVTKIDSGSNKYQVLYNSSSTYEEAVQFYRDSLPGAKITSLGLGKSFVLTSDSYSLIIYVLESRSSGTTGQCTVDLTITTIK